MPLGVILELVLHRTLPSQLLKKSLHDDNSRSRSLHSVHLPVFLLGNVSLVPGKQLIAQDRETSRDRRESMHSTTKTTSASEASHDGSHKSSLPRMPRVLDSLYNSPLIGKRAAIFGSRETQIP